MELLGEEGIAGTPFHKQRLRTPHLREFEVLDDGFVLNGMLNLDCRGRFVHRSALGDDKFFRDCWFVYRPDAVKSRNEVVNDILRDGGDEIDAFLVLLQLLLGDRDKLRRSFVIGRGLGLWGDGLVNSIRFFSFVFQLGFTGVAVLQIPRFVGA